jgi:hypothetical protein
MIVVRFATAQTRKLLLSWILFVAAAVWFGAPFFRQSTVALLETRFLSESSRHMPFPLSGYLYPSFLLVLLAAALSPNLVPIQKFPPGVQLRLQRISLFALCLLALFAWFYVVWAVVTPISVPGLIVMTLICWLIWILLFELPLTVMSAEDADAADSQSRLARLRSIRSPLGAERLATWRKAVQRHGNLGMTEGPRRGGCLPTFLVSMLFLLTAAAASYLLAGDQGRRSMPLSRILPGDRLRPGIFALPKWGAVLFVLVVVTNLISAIGIWQWRRWGVFGLLATPLIVFLVNVAAGVNLVVPVLAFLLPAVYSFVSSARREAD